MFAGGNFVLISSAEIRRSSEKVRGITGTGVRGIERISSVSSGAIDGEERVLRMGAGGTRGFRYVEELESLGDEGATLF